jgi:hypothetical protein
VKCCALFLPTHPSPIHPKKPKSKKTSIHPIHKSTQAETLLSCYFYFFLYSPLGHHNFSFLDKQGKGEPFYSRMAPVHLRRAPLSPQKYAYPLWSSLRVVNGVNGTIALFRNVSFEQQPPKNSKTGNICRLVRRLTGLLNKPNGFTNGRRGNWQHNCRRFPPKTLSLSASVAILELFSVSVLG